MKKLTEFVNLSLTFKVKYVDSILQITICEHNKAVGKIRCNIDTNTIEYLKIDEYNRLSMFATILLRKLFIICKDCHNISVLKMQLTKKQYDNNKDAITSICNKFSCTIDISDTAITITCKMSKSN